jgi:signal transduction histidine kinase
VKLPTSATDARVRARTDRAVELTAPRRADAALCPSAALAHDLRSPLAAVLGFARLAREELAAGDSAQAARLIERVERSGATLETILRSALDASPRGAVTQLGPVLEQVHAERKCELERRGIRWLAPAEAPPLAVRHADLYRLLGNLVGNALDHMGDARDGAIAVTITCHRGTATLRVLDNGVGIPPDQRERVFDVDHSRNRSERSRARRGLGLAIVRQLAAGWGGRAWVEASPLPGATLCVTIPVAS